MSFDAYVGGKTIAVVGPAPLPYDQSAEIDAHDLVYRPAHSPQGGWYGERCDIAYLNGQAGRIILDPEGARLRANIDRADWWVFKARQGHQFRPDGLQRNAHRPDKVRNPNAVTGILWDLSHFHPASVTVYGADLYAGGPGNAYHPDYDARDVAEHAHGIILHEPWQQMRAHRAIHAAGLTIGDDRYIAAVTMPDDQYQAVIDSWRQALEPLT